MTDILILPIKPNSISNNDKQALCDAGVIVVEHEEPDSLRLIKPTIEIHGNKLLAEVMRGLNAYKQTQTVKDDLLKLIENMVNS